MTLGTLVHDAVDDVKNVVHDVVADVEGIFGKEFPEVFTDFETVYKELKTKTSSLKKLAADSTEYETLKAEITADASVVKAKFDLLVASL